VPLSFYYLGAIIGHWRFLLVPKGAFNFFVMLALQQLKKLSEEGVKPINLIEYEEGLRV
jgi:hypothetical protein